MVPLVSRERIGNRSLDIEITPADATRDGGGDNPSRPVGKGGNAGWRLKSQKSTENIVSIFFIGAEQPLLDGDEVPIGETRCGFDLASLREPLASKFGTLIRISLVVVGINSRPLPEK